MPASRSIEPKRPSDRRTHTHSYSEDVNEAPSQVEGEPVEVEREVPADQEENPSIERLEPHKPPPPPLFEE